ncbi:helix-turn-helix domain-containing protein [Pontibacter pamirensis]|uniref:helix-turn-helix domain-containing protein n=1 Tax=Pontibacter pamirensis TaxID=2562824 RepID=UPI0013895AF3|nr:helix-turn-helix domain-containing protein [Pontibacter pamirensis]
MPNNLLIYMTAHDAIEAIAQRTAQILREDKPEQKQPNPEAEEPISIQEVCSLLKVSRPTLHNWMAQGTIPFHRKGRRVYLFKSQVLKSLEEPKRLGRSRA